jgi:hypothetical protein
MENDGAQPCNYADEYKVESPFAGKSDVDGTIFVDTGSDSLFKTA